MIADIQFVYLRREGYNYRVSHTMIDMTFIGRPGDVIWWYQGEEYIAFECVESLHSPQPQWIEWHPAEQDFEEVAAKQKATVEWVNSLIEEHKQ